MTFLLTPGPVQIRREVLEAESYLASHRSAEFRDIVKECNEGILDLAKADFAAITTGSGTLAIESMIYSFLRKGDEVLNVEYGEFGNRLGGCLERRGIKVHSLQKKSEDALTFDEIEQNMEGKNLSAITLVHNETGNGTSIHNLEDITRKCKDAGLKVIVDSVSGFANHPISIKGTGIDMFATCGHKGIASTPGIGIVAMDSGVERELDDTGIPAYLDLKKSIKFMGKDETPYTPSVGSFNALRTALKFLREEGIDNRITRTAGLSSYVRKELENHGFHVNGSDRTYSNSVVNFSVRNEPKKLVGELLERGYLIAKGMGALADSTLRVGVMGSANREVLGEFLEALYAVDKH